METPKPRARRAGWLTLFGVIVLSFLGATTYVHWRMHAIDRAAVGIAENTGPSIERLATARAEMRQIQLLIRAYRNNGGIGTFDAQPYEIARERMDEKIVEYTSLPITPGEQALWTHLLRAHTDMREALARFEAEAAYATASHDLALSRARDVTLAADELGAAITSAIQVNAAHSTELAVEIQRVRTRTTTLAFVLDAICAGITLAGAILLWRILRTHDALVEQHRRLVEERASEMEQFAGRVAHDILSPLGTVGFALELGSREGADEAQRVRALERGTAALGRVKLLVHGLLRFARAGAKPEPDASAPVGATIADVLADLAVEASAAGITLRSEHGAHDRVRCDPGVLTSLVANLTRNAVKYMGEGPRREVLVRTSSRGELVRVEVVDTGTGLPPGLETQVFEPYVRVRASSGKPGIGLGLATVKRIAEAHGGSVGVRSVPGEGSTFWFELPRAGDDAPDAESNSGVVPRARQAS